MNEPRVTVLMSVHNGSRFLREAIDSILAQTFRDFELLVIDDASTDDSAAIVESYRDPRIRMLRNEANQGLTKSLNRGLRDARGSLIARHDADDRSHPQRLEQQVAWFDAHPQGALVGTQPRIIDEHGWEIGKVVKATSETGIRWQSMFSNPFIHTAVMFRRDVVLGLGGYDETFRFNQDFELWSRMIGSFECSNLAETLVDYRAHAESIAGRRDEAVLASRRANVARNKLIQHRNVRRETGSDTLAIDWPELWTAINVPWLTDAPRNPARALDLIDALWKVFAAQHAGVVWTKELAMIRAAALVVVAMYLAERNRVASLRAMLRAWRDDARQAIEMLPRWLLLLLAPPRLVAVLRERRARS